MTRYLYYAVILGVVSVAMPLRAANRPHAETDSQNTMVWTNDDLEKLHSLALISIVGSIDGERPTPAPAPRPYVRTQDPEWYAVQAAKLRDELERRQTQLSEYRQAIDDARSLRKTMGGGMWTKCKRRSTNWKTWPATTISRRARCAANELL